MALRLSCYTSGHTIRTSRPGNSEEIWLGLGFLGLGISSLGSGARILTQPATSRAHTQPTSEKAGPSMARESITEDAGLVGVLSSLTE